MTIDEVLNESKFSDIKRNLAILALAGATASGITAGVTSFSPEATAITMRTDNQLTRVGKEAIKELPGVIQNKLGNINDISFVKGIPKGGDPNAICQVVKGERIIYVNPEFEKEFLSGKAYQLVAHELTHIAQSRMHQKFPDTDYTPGRLYGDMATPDSWVILLKARKSGDRMWNHSREEQSMIVQQRTAQYHMLKQMIKNNNDPDNIRLAKQKISIYDAYINDYNGISLF